jgi:MoxR-like ATPase
MITGLLAKANGFIGGLPGTGKTALTKAIASAFEGNCFYYLVSRTTVPDEIIGAIDLIALQQGKGFVRDLSKGIVNSHIAILDEGFKGNSATLNSLLGIILDKEFNNSGHIVKSPLNSLWICSNELPENNEEANLIAFWDRLPLRFWVHELSIQGKITLMRRTAGLEAIPTVQTKFSLTELSTLQSEAANIPINDSVIEAIALLTQELENKHGLVISSRKHNQLVELIRCYAYACGETEVNDEHLELLKHTLWNKPSEQPLIAELLKKFGNPLTEKINLMLEAAKTSFQSIPGFDGMERTKWVTQATSSDTELKEIEQQFNELLTQNAQKKISKKIESALIKVQSYRLSIKNKILELYK